jgi:hypothetical protein
MLSLTSTRVALVVLTGSFPMPARRSAAQSKAACAIALAHGRHGHELLQAPESGLPRLLESIKQCLLWSLLMSNVKIINSAAVFVTYLSNMEGEPLSL